ncbi:MAG: glutathione S-transferase family protein [Cycloclasticus sp.]
MKLYLRPDCPFCWKVRLFLFEIEFDCQEVIVELGTKHPDVVALNPNATVPVLIDGALILFESAVIIEYLVDKFPESRLMSGTPVERANIRQIHSYSDNSMGKILFPYIKQVRENGAASVGADVKRTTSVAWTGCQEKLSVLLGGKDFFSADFSVAECALIPRFALAMTYGLTIDKEFNNLQRWYLRCAKRASFIRALPASFPGINN